MIRAVYLVQYPEGVPAEEVERFFLDIHMREQRRVPGLRRYVSYRNLVPPDDPLMSGERYERLIELWFDDIEAYRRYRAEMPNFTKAPYGDPTTQTKGSLTFGKMAGIMVAEVPEWNLMEMA
jgi:hypothetical protein